MKVKLSSVLTGFFGLTMIISFTIFIWLMVLSLRSEALIGLDAKFQSVLNLNEKVLQQTIYRSRSLTKSLSETFMTIKAFVDMKSAFETGNHNIIKEIYRSAGKDRSSILMGDGTENYEFMHEAHHVQIKKYLETTALSDLILINSNGQIFYSFKKGELFGETLSKISGENSKAEFLQKLISSTDIDTLVSSGIFVNKKQSPSFYSVSPLLIAEKISGYIITELPFKHIGNQLNDVGSLGKTGSIIITDIQGDLLTWKSSKITGIDSWKFPKELLNKTQPFNQKSQTVQVSGKPYKTIMRKINAEEQHFLLLLQQAEEEIFKHSQELQFELITGGFMILIVALFTISFISQYISNPLKTLTNELNNVASGNSIDTKKIRSSFYEIQKVSKALDAFHESTIARQKLERSLVDRSLEMEMMNVEMKHANEELEQYRAHLEDLVHDRTKVIEEQASQLEQALEAQKELNDLQRSFVSMASHEFRTPLAIIDAVTQKLIRRSESITAEKLKQHGTKIRSAVVRMTSLMESTLNAARMENGKIQVNIQECNLKKILTENCKNQQELASSHQINIDLENAPDTIQADPSALDQIITNLLSNAVKYSPDSPHIDVKVHTDTNNIYIAITDHGLGIDEDEIPQMFTRFFRAKTSTGIAGTGIGLNLSKMLVEEHGGEIILESEKGVGSTFTIRLPFKREEAA